MIANLIAIATLIAIPLMSTGLGAAAARRWRDERIERWRA